MEVTDFASKLEAIHNESALAAHLAQQEVLTGPSAEFCQGADCDMPIPEDRRQAMPGVQLCTKCQKHREKRSRR
jgi:phage/conjugal plasmid C-4 type zinc finger TraR family protein